MKTLKVTCRRGTSLEINISNEYSFKIKDGCPLYTNISKIKSKWIVKKLYKVISLYRPHKLI
jgi:hypothetical protein